MRYLITGVSGFVGGHYLEYLFARSSHVRVFGVDTCRPNFDFLKARQRKKVKFYHGSLLSKTWVKRLVEKVKPDYIVHLASHSSAAYSWKNPLECYANNTGIFLNILEAARETGANAKILSVGSADEYGITGQKNAPLTERTLLNPLNPYAVGRIAQEYFSKIYADTYKIPIISTRSFNHIGPRQKEVFAISSFAKQVIEVKKGRRKKIVCGDLNIVKDFMDVRDVVRAYDSLLRKGKTGHVYNVCSGKGYKLSNILRMLQKKAGTNAKVVSQNPSLARPSDNAFIVGSPAKLKRDTSFKPNYPLSRSLSDILAYWQPRA